MGLKEMALLRKVSAEMYCNVCLCGMFCVVLINEHVYSLEKADTE